MSPHRVLTTGNAMTARAAIDAGCRFFAGYPITPASGIFRDMTRALPGRGGVALSAPDEISALAYCVGASLRGALAMTATSGPGWCLMTETVGFALMTETPVVIVLGQRLGPSTGAATQGAQGDLDLVRSAVSGGYRFPVFTPSTAEECYEDTLRAFAWAERLRTPVVLLTDKEVSTTSEVVDLAALPTPEPVQRAEWQGEGEFLTYRIEELTDVPPFAPVGGPDCVAVTGSSHNQRGDLSKDSPEALALQAHLEAKVAAAEPALGRVDVDSTEPAETLVVSFGVSARACRDTVSQVRSQGVQVRFANVRTVSPLPRTALVEALAGTRRLVVVEENHSGQLRALIVASLREELSAHEVLGVNRAGRAIRPQEIVDVIA